MASLTNMGSTINTLLIANRGEIASRIMHTCKKMGIASVAVYSDADKDALFVKQADMAIHIGASEPSKSYLDVDKIIAAAKRSGADAIHPGYGFLSENAAFAKRCEKENIIFVGPHPKAIAAMGSKSKAKSIMEKAQVPTIPGYKGSDQSLSTLKSEALKIGFPLLLKATAGGGGKGMRIVYGEKDLESAIEAAKRESSNAFGDDELLIEKYIESGRHIEFQIFGDQHKNVIHLFERECSIQRRYQKVIEESPSPIMDSELRTRMGEAAVLAGKALDYDNAGTVEFIFDDKTKEFYFLEVNTRLQVEHPVTEAITQLDLVHMQLQSAQGLPLKILQEEVSTSGYAIEARLYAEDPVDFSPVTGTIYEFSYPEIEGLRMESAISSGSEVSVFYDPMIAKVVVWGEDRATAHTKLRHVLKHLKCQGTVTNLPFLQALLAHDDFAKGQYNTHFIDEKINLETVGTLSDRAKSEAAIAATIYDWHQRNQSRKLLKSLPSGWRNNFYEPQKHRFQLGDEDIQVAYRYFDNGFDIAIDKESYRANIVHVEANIFRINIDGLQKDYTCLCVKGTFYIHTPEWGNVALKAKDRFPEKEKEKIKGGYEAPMPSQIIKIHVSPKQKVKAGDPLIVISSMKMENTILSEEDGEIEEVYTEEGTNVEAGFLLLKINGK